MISEIRSLSSGSTSNPAEIRDILLDGPTKSTPQILWFGTPSGLHQLKLNDNVIIHSGLLENPGTDDIPSRELNDVHSIYSTGEEIIIGSIHGTWALAGDYSSVYQILQEESIPATSLNWELWKLMEIRRYLVLPHPVNFLIWTNGSRIK